MTLFDLKRFISIAIILPAIILYTGCSDNSQSIFRSESDSSKFPEKFIEKGSDFNHTYVSLQTVRTGEGLLEVRTTFWAISEAGPILGTALQDSLLSLEAMYRCGTILSETWDKVAFNITVEQEDEQELQEIILKCRDTTLRLER